MVNKKKLIKARAKIDLLDSKIFILIKKRTTVVKQMLNLKQNRAEIIDKKRINQILKKIRIKSIKNKIDPRISARIWKSMIWSYIDYQKRNFRKK